MLKKIILALVFIYSFHSNAQTTTPAPTTCSKSPCLQISWTEAAQFLPGTATIAICNGGTVGCGTPSSPGPNGWSFYTTSQTTTSTSAITPTLSYGALIQYTVNFSNQGGTSAWAAPQTFQIGQAPPPPVPTTPGTITAKQL